MPVIASTSGAGENRHQRCRRGARSLVLQGGGDATHPGGGDEADAAHNRVEATDVHPHLRRRTSTRGQGHAGVAGPPGGRASLPR
jgi:hypothetical protein